MSRALAALAAGFALAVAAVACSPTVTPIPTRSPTPIPTPSLALPTPGSVATPDASRHADPSLEALLPASLGGVSLRRESQRGTDLTRQSDAMDTLLKDLGKTLADFTLASAYSDAGEVKAQVGAWRVAGASTALLMPEFVKAVQASSTTPLTVAETSLAGRTVTQIGVAGQLTQGPLYAFVRDDIVLFVQTPDPELAREALAAIK